MRTYFELITELCRIICYLQISIKSYGKFDKGKLVVINTDNNSSPVAVGWTALSSVDMYMSARHGKAVIIAHVFKDYLWESGSKSPVPKVMSHSCENKEENGV